MGRTFSTAAGRLTIEPTSRAGTWEVHKGRQVVGTIEVADTQGGYWVTPTGHGTRTWCKGLDASIRLMGNLITS